MEAQPKAVSIERYSESRAEETKALILGIQRDEFGIPITIEDQPDLGDIPSFYQVGAGDFWVAVAEGETVGTIALLDIGEGRLALRKMFVKSEYRGRGSDASKALLMTAITWARLIGIQEILLGTTEKFLAAHRFYEKNGFARVERAELPPSFPQMSVDTRFYRFSLRKADTAAARAG